MVVAVFCLQGPILGHGEQDKGGLAVEVLELGLQLLQPVRLFHYILLDGIRLHYHHISQSNVLERLKDLHPDELHLVPVIHRNYATTDLHQLATWSC